MSRHYYEGEYERLYNEGYAELKAHGLTDQEAKLIITLDLAPHGERNQADDLGLTVEEFRKIYSIGAKKYLANGGKDFWQNWLK